MTADDQDPHDVPPDGVELTWSRSSTITSSTLVALALVLSLASFVLSIVALVD